HEGKGVFTYTPVGYRRNGIVIIEYAGKKYDFDLPESLPQGVAMEVDNMSRTDSIGIVLRKNADTPAEMLGVTITNGGRLQNFAFVWMDDPEIRISMDKTRLATGVSQVVLFNSKGDILCDRLIFNYNMDDRLIISAKSGKQTYMPYERVDVEMTVTDRQLNPVQTTFSVSVRDGANGIENNHTVLTDLLLMSEIKGYVRNPSYYFEDKNNTKETRPATSLHLDLLLMVQGWRRYSWKQMAGVDKFELKYFPEQGIETIGTVLTSRLFSKLKPKPDVDVTLVIYLLGKDGEQGSGAAAYFITDEHGQFSFTSGVEGRWNMYLTASEKGKEKNYPIVIDRLFSPEPGRYRYADLKVNPAEIEKESVDYVDFQAEADSLTIASQDSLGVLGTDEKMQYLAEVTVTAKRTRERDIYRNRSTAITYYDAASALENMYDRTGFSGNNIYELMQNMNKDFMSRWSGGKEIFLYKNKRPLFVIDYVPVNLDNPAWTEMPVINPNAIKSIYINETTTAKCNYANSKDLTCMNLDDLLSCVVFIETLPEEEIMADPVKGVRQTRLDGYSLIEEFYSPDYSALPTEPDYRRTLYWNPMVTSDDSGKANLHFYNNSRTENFNISAETTTSQGLIGILQE
ncbi:MAG: hypothetical protein LBE56_01250, partial [Tannerella sp.]|nr:hypothetical protein [Tannerella sp.]